MSLESQKLSELPYEILGAIFQYIYWGPYHCQYLCALSLVCKPFHRVIRPLLFRQAYLMVGTSAEKPQSFNFLCRSIKEAPELALHIQSIQLEAIKFNPIVHNKIDDFLCELVALRKLVLKATSARSSEIYSGSFLKINPLPLLEHLYIFSVTLAPQAFAELIFLPSLKFLNIKDVRTTKEFTITSEIAGRKCNVTTLRADWITALELEKLLGLTTSLKELVSGGFVEPGHIVPLDVNRRRRLMKLSPGLMSTTLTPVLGILEKLLLTDQCSSWSEHDGSRLDLSAAEKLKSITVPGYYFFPKTDRNNNFRAHLGFYKLLPRSIEDISIDFEVYHPLISTPRETNGRFPDQPSQECPELDWLMEVFQHKATSMPHLKKIYIWAAFWPNLQKGLDDEENGNNFEWKPAVSIVQAASRVGVDLEIYVHDLS